MGYPQSFLFNPQTSYLYPRIEEAICKSDVKKEKPLQVLFLNTFGQSYCVEACKYGHRHVS